MRGTKDRKPAFSVFCVSSTVIQVTLSITLIHHKGHWKGLEGQQDGNLMVTRMLNDTAKFQGPKECTV